MPTHYELHRKEILARYHTPKGRKYQIERSRKSLLKLKHGLTPEEYDALVRHQGNLCAICWRPEHRKSGARSTQVKCLAVDHDHLTGARRGLLCHDCNIALGLFYDDPLRLKAAIDYLTLFSEK